MTTALVGLMSIAAAKPAAQGGAKKGAPADPWAGRKDLFVAPVITPSTNVDLGKVSRASLPNGLGLILIPRPAIPTFDIAIVVRAGDAMAPVEKSGLARFVADMLRKGTKTRTADQIAEEIDFVGGDLSTAASEDGAVVTCRVRARDWRLCVDLVADVVMNPTFPEAEMGEVRDQMKAAIEATKDSPQSLALAHAVNLYFGDADTRGRPASLRTLAAIDRNSVVDFHARHYAPNVSTVAVTGAFDDAALRAELQKRFGAWKRKEVPPAPTRGLPKLVDGGKLQVRVVDKPDATQSAIVLVGPGIAHRAPDFYATKLMSYTLGEGAFSSRLMRVVRSEGGKTYGARASFEASREPGTFHASTFTRTPETVATLKLVLDEIAKMRKSGPTAEELQAAKGNLIGGYGLALESGRDVARALLDAVVDELDPKYVEELPARLQKVTLDEARAAAAAHLRPQALVVVGKAAEVKPMLERARLDVDGAIEVVPYTAPIAKVEREAAVKEKAAAGTVSAEEAAVGKALLAEAIAAKGGKAYEGLKEISYSGKGTLTAKGNTVNVTLNAVYAWPRAAKEELTISPPGLTVVQVVPPEGKPFAKQGPRVLDPPAEMTAALERQRFRDPNFILRLARDKATSVGGKRGVSDGGKSWDTLVVVPPDGPPVTLFLDPKTHLITKMEYVEEGQKGVDRLEDYRPEGGVQIPRRLVHEAPDEASAMTIEGVKVNEGVPPKAFARE
jgi:zinc protease